VNKKFYEFLYEISEFEYYLKNINRSYSENRTIHHIDSLFLDYHGVQSDIDDFKNNIEYWKSYIRNENKIHYGHGSIKCISTNKVYCDIRRASEDLLVDAEAIRKVAEGKIKSVRGFKFEFLNKGGEI